MKIFDEFLRPDLYDLFNEGYTEDVNWYINFCKQNGHKEVLEIGIGTGRIARQAQTGSLSVDDIIIMGFILSALFKVISI